MIFLAILKSEQSLYYAEILIKFVSLILIPQLINGNLNKTNLKFILIWTHNDRNYYPPPFNETTCNLQSDPFRDHSCKYQNCYYTSDKGLLKSVADFHAIMFYGVEVGENKLPKKRKSFQYYVDLMDEPSVAFTMDRCHLNNLNNFFNVTITYKLDSDIPWPYFRVIDKSDYNTVVGPRNDMEWKESPKKLSKEYLKRLNGKTELAAWFVSHCNAKNNRTLFGYILYQRILERSNLSIDVFGNCSYLKCPQNGFEDCNQMLSDNYLFYLAFENSNTEDYITEKVLRALQNDVVPVVYGGANYSRFLPPGSFIDAKKLGARKLALVMLYLYSNRRAYSKYFYWKNTYEFRDNVLGFSCDLCAILNSNSREPRTHPRFTDWWNGRDVSDSPAPNRDNCLYDNHNAN